MEENEKGRNEETKGEKEELRKYVFGERSREKKVKILEKNYKRGNRGK